MDTLAHGALGAVRWSRAFQQSNQGGISDRFVSKLNSAGSELAYSTYLGESGLDLCKQPRIEKLATMRLLGMVEALKTQ